MFLVQVTCSDADCTEEIDALVDDLDELNGLVCDCGYGTVALSIAVVELV